MFSHLTSLVRAASAVSAGISHRTFLAEALERRVLLSAAEIGLVTMPYDGALSAAVYDAVRGPAFSGHLLIEPRRIVHRRW